MNDQTTMLDVGRMLAERGIPYAGFGPLVQCWPVKNGWPCYWMGVFL
jgi:hypothetical protein